MTQIFQDFSQNLLSPPKGTPRIQTDLDSFDAGYKAGWDDASKAHVDSKEHLSTVLVRNLETLEFTLVEAQGLALGVLAPVIQEVTNALFPGLKSEMVRAHVTDALEQILRDAGPTLIELQVAPQDLSIVKSLLGNGELFDRVSVSAKETLAEGQVYISCSDQTQMIDIPAAVAEIQTVINAAQTSKEMDQAHAV